MLEENQISSPKSLKVSRRDLMQGALAVAGGAAVTALVPSPVAAQSHDAEASRFTGDLVSASIQKNVVETDSGKVSGFVSGNIVTFKGIPYGASTTGRNRFMAPAKPVPWTGVRSALHWGWVSPQVPTSTFSGVRGSWAHDDEAFMFQWDDGQPDEDCLRLNVWTPATDNKKRPVMFWIHGGGFTTGSSNEMAAYDGENLARRGDVIVVSLNHRLGALGFMNLLEYGDEYAHSGNVGVLDIVAALEWVKTNISNFGGDPGKVMIFGQSGGGGKVSALMGMPAAKGLFHRAVIQSSGGPIHQISREASAATSASVLKKLGISKQNLAKLHELPNEAIVQAGFDVSKEPKTGVVALGAWGPVVEGHDLPRHAWDPTAPEFSASVPLLIGNVLNEMGNSIQMGDASLEDMSATEVKRRLTVDYGPRADAIIEAISGSHTIKKPFDVLAIAGGLPRRSDVLAIAALKAKQGGAPAYVYKFVWQTPVLDGRPRSFHCSELPFVFYNSDKCSSMTGGGPEPMALGAKISDAWINFARNGDPNHAGLPKWPAYSPDSAATMVFDTKSEVKNNYEAAEMKAMAGNKPTVI
jgi:para-nitrobenzyl esterase